MVLIELTSSIDSFPENYITIELFALKKKRYEVFFGEENRGSLIFIFSSWRKTEERK